VIFYYLDASAWVKRYYEEPGTRWVQELFAQNPTIACATLGLIEVMATLARKQKARDIDLLSLHRRRKNWRRIGGALSRSN
jgi:predicted nucleic acid-binding protein